MATPRRLLDLKRRAETTLNLTREEMEPTGNVLRLDRKHKSRAISFDLKNEMRSDDRLFVADAPRRRPMKRLAMLGLALTLIATVSLAGMWGTGKATIERVLTSATDGVATLTSAGQAFAAGDFLAASGEFKMAREAFTSAESDIQTLAGAGAVLATRPETVQSGSRLVTAGRLIASAGTRFATVADTMSLAIATWPERQRRVSAGETAVTSFSAQIATVSAEALAGLAELEAADSVLRDVDTTVLPDGIGTKVADSRAKLALALNVIKPLADGLPSLPDVLGNRVPKKYLILFQNPDEIRPTGGFIGSVGELTMNDGFVQEFRIRDVYELTGQMRRVIPPPAGYERLTNRWGLQDANTSPDWPTSAAQAAWLYEESGGGTVDGVIGVTADVLTRLATATDGVTLPRYGHIAADDLTLLLSMVIETKQSGAAAPKQILNDVYKNLLTNIQTLPATTLASVARDIITSRDVQTWFTDETAEASIRKTIFGGALADVSSDYLLVSDTSLSGNKSDRYTRNVITHETDIADGDVTNRLTITRTHDWTADEETRIRALAKRYDIALGEAMIDLLGRGKNVDMLRIFVPAGAELVSAEGVAMSDVTTSTALDRTYFEVTLETHPTEAKTITLTYRVPTDADKYALTADSPVGVAPTAFTKIIRVDGKEVMNETKTVNERTEWRME